MGSMASGSVHGIPGGAIGPGSSAPMGQRVREANGDNDPEPVIIVEGLGHYFQAARGTSLLWAAGEHLVQHAVHLELRIAAEVLRGPNTHATHGVPLYVVREFYSTSASEGKSFIRCAAVAACRRFDTPNFAMMRETCTLAVLSEMNSRLAIC